MTSPRLHCAPSDDSATLRIQPSPRAHLVGIAGCGMRSLAELLHQSGWQVSGSDLNTASLAGSRFAVLTGHRASAIDEGLDLVVYSDAVPRTNPEISRAQELGVETLSYPRMLARLMSDHYGVAVAGTHGKSTTTAMAGEILAAAHLDATVIYGANPVGGGSGGHWGHGRLMLCEACEYRTNFRHLKPELAVVLGIEADHFDCFNSLAEVERAFTRFARNVPAEGLMLARAECAATRRALAGLNCASETFGFAPTAAWQAGQLRERRGYYSFQIRCRTRLVCDVKLNVPGRHNVLNALASAALASHCGASAAAISAGLARFAGLQRRIELVDESAEIAVVDDYAHHPTAVAATLATLRQVYPDRRLCCVFQPHQLSRTRCLLDELATSLQNADNLVVADVYRARETAAQPQDVSGAHLAARARKLGQDAIHLASAAQITRHLQDSLRPGDVLVTIGAGDIGNIAHEFGKGLRTFRQAG